MLIPKNIFSTPKLTSGLITVALMFNVGCGEELQVSEKDMEPEEINSSSEEQSLYFNEEVAQFIFEGLEGHRDLDETIQYTIQIPQEDGTIREDTIILGFEEVIQKKGQEGVPTGSLAFGMDYSLSYCVSDREHYVSKTIWATSCSKSSARSSSDYWSGYYANNACDSVLDVSDYDDECDPHRFTNNICVDETYDDTISEYRYGSKVCGVWPFRSKKWKVTHKTSGYCGFSCRASL
ncbi:MAG: hypothetical protein VYA34_03325 [Myxococcota bacterium]|nr:hypothetical protein [Myxococcota bacterium]